MRLTTEVKDYIQKRVDTLVPKPAVENVFEDIKPHLDSVCEELQEEIKALFKKATEDLVKLYPELVGLEFEISRYGKNAVVYEYKNTDIWKDVLYANELRRQHMNDIVAMVQFDAGRIKDSIALDERIVELVNR